MQLHVLATLLSLATIVFLLLPVARDPSIFRAHLPLRAYHTRRNYAVYPFAQTCSARARAHYRARHTRFPSPLAPPASLTGARNRVFLSSIPEEVGDGLGHRTAILNYELTLSRMLHLTYTHRNSTYGSLTRVDRTAVDDFFRWGAGSPTRGTLLEKACAEVRYVYDQCDTPAKRVTCARVRPRSRGGWFDQSVIIPDSISTCLLTRETIPLCASQIRAFLAAYPEANTLFQLSAGHCFHGYLYTNFSGTHALLKRRYWAAATAPRWDEGRVQTALHVRRGDFFNYTNRVLVSDNSFADVVWRVKHAVDEMIAGDVPMDVHVYSEGRARGRVKDVHDTGVMDDVYIDETGVPRAGNHWEGVIKLHRRSKKGDLRVFTHIAGDTLAGVREMLAADVFVGSVSGLSVQVVRTFGRGVLVLPVWEGEVGEEETGVVPFEWGRNGLDSFVDEQLLYRRIAESVRRNRLACAVW